LDYLSKEELERILEDKDGNIDTTIPRKRKDD
jgi:hypothetical protein